jgi:ribonuclease P protein component
VVLVAARSKLGPDAPARLGLVVSRKVGTAVKRNKLKRWVREWFRRAEGLPKGVDFVVIAKPGSVERGYAAIWADLKLLIASVVPERLA